MIVEAELMVALEAMKTSTDYLNTDIVHMGKAIVDQWNRIDGNLADAISDLEEIIVTSKAVN